MEIRLRALALTSPCFLSPSASVSATISFASIPTHHWRATPLSSSRSLPRPPRFSGIKAPRAELESSFEVLKKADEIADELKGASLFLVGMKSEMKTNVGKILADAFAYYFFDSDSVLEQAFGGESKAKLCREEDEKGFRESETEVLRQLCSMGRVVLCAGDGAVLTSTNMALLRDGIIIWIDVPLELIAAESVGPTSEVLDELTRRYNELREGYGTADATVSLQRVASQLGYEDLDSVTIDDMAIETLKQVERLARVKKMLEAAAKPF